MNADSLHVGLIGCGAISGAYFAGAKTFPFLDIVACADLDASRARAVATQHGVARACSVDELLADPSIDIVLNLTVPQAHADVSLRAIEARKHVYLEKPLAVNRDDGRRMLDAARERGVRIGCAPDTFLGAGLQTARRVIDDGAIGKPVAFTAFMMCPGHESWHPNPEFYYQPGGGPMFDMGPYYLTALLNFFGPVRRVSGAASVAIPQRTIGSEPKRGQKIHVGTPDHVCGTIEFENGVIGSIVMSFATRFPTHDGAQPITVYGTEGTMRVPDPNQFDGPVHVRRSDDPDWREATPRHHRGYSRSVGLADMASAIRADRPHRCSAEQAFAVLDLMQAFFDSADSGRAIAPTTKYERPAPMRAELPFGSLDA